MSRAPSTTGQLSEEDVLHRIYTYRPRDPDLQMVWLADDVLREFVVTLVTGAGWTSRDALTNALRSLIDLGQWCQDRSIALSPHSVLRPQVVEAFLTGLPDDQVQERHRALLRVSQAQGIELVPKLRKPKPVTVVPDPYTDAEVEAHLQAAMGQSTEKKRRTYQTSIALCRGAGAFSAEAQWAQPRDFHFEPNHVAVTFGEPKPRTVPLLRRFHGLARELCEGIEPNDYLTGRDPARYKSTHLAWLVDGARQGTAPLPVLRVRRLRQAWLYDMIQRPIPLADLLAAAGVSESALIKELGNRLPPGDPTAVRELFEEDR